MNDSPIVMEPIGVLIAGARDMEPRLQMMGTSNAARLRNLYPDEMIAERLPDADKAWYDNIRRMRLMVMMRADLNNRMYQLADSVDDPAHRALMLDMIDAERLVGGPVPDPPDESQGGL